MRTPEVYVPAMKLSMFVSEIGSRAFLESEASPDISPKMLLHKLNDLLKG